MTNTAASSAGWSEPTPDLIAEWKKEHGTDIHRLKARDTRDNTIKHAYCRTPNLSDFSRAAESDKKKLGTYNQSLYENCVLLAHPDIKAVPALYQGVIFKMSEIIVAADVEVEKL